MLGNNYMIVDSDVIIDSMSLYWKYSTGQKWSSGVLQWLRWKWTNLDEIWNSVS